MNTPTSKFLIYLASTIERRSAARAALRRSLTRPPGEDAETFAIVERFVGAGRALDDPWRLALYTGAGLYADAPIAGAQPIAYAAGQLAKTLHGNSVEKRFLTALQANPENLSIHIIQLHRLLKAHELAYDYAALIDDLRVLLSHNTSDVQRQTCRQRWGQAFYSALYPENERQLDPRALTVFLKDLNTAGHEATRAVLARSLTFDPGADPATFGLIEPIVSASMHPRDARRQAAYLAAGLFAWHPKYQENQTLAKALNRYCLAQDGAADGVERQINGVLAAPHDAVPDHLRRLVARLRGDNTGFDPALLQADLVVWLSPFTSLKRLDIIRQRWANDFFQQNINDNNLSQQAEGA